MRFRGVRGRQPVKFTVTMPTDEGTEGFVRLLLKYGIPLTVAGRTVTIEDVVAVNAPTIDVEVDEQS